MDDLEYLVRLNRSGMAGSSLLRRLLEHPELKRIPRLSPRDLQRIPGIGPITAQALTKAPDPAIAAAARRGIEILPSTGPTYPPRCAPSMTIPSCSNDADARPTPTRWPSASPAPMTAPISAAGRPCASARNWPATADALAATTRLPLSSVEHAIESLSDKGMAAAGARGGFSRPADGATMARHGSPPL